MFTRLTDCEITMHGETTRDAAIVTAGRVMLCTGTFRQQQMWMFGFRRRDRNHRMLFHIMLSMPLPSRRGAFALYSPDASFRNDRCSMELDVTTWFFQFNFMYNRQLLT